MNQDEEFAGKLTDLLRFRSSGYDPKPRVFVSLFTVLPPARFAECRLELECGEGGNVVARAAVTEGWSQASAGLLTDDWPYYSLTLGASPWITHPELQVEYRHVVYADIDRDAVNDRAFRPSLRFIAHARHGGEESAGRSPRVAAERVLRRHLQNLGLEPGGVAR